MAVKIRLRRIGRKKQPSYRVVVAEQTTPRDGAYVDAVGFYNPRRSPRAELRLDLERVDYWIDQGAGMTPTVASLVRKARKGGDDRVELVPLSGPEPAVAAPAPETPAAAAPTAEPAGATARERTEIAADVGGPPPEPPVPGPGDEQVEASGAAAEPVPEEPAGG